MSDSDNPGIFQAPEIEEVALLFPNYDVHSLIACGGMGAVYHATQRSLDRGVAIKLLPREFSEDEAFRTGFEAEAKAMAKLNHPNLIGVYDFGEVGGMLYITMEYVAGKSLFHSAHGAAIDPADAIRIVSEVCSGLEHAHYHGILHRDIKPGNILLDPNVSPKIGDFGLARALESKIEEGEQIFGTPGYTAPEVLEPPFEFDQRADVFSVGVMLHELLTGKLPGDDPRPASVLSACNPRLDAVIRRAMHPDPASRYSSASEFAAELEKIASSPARAIISGASAAAAGKAFVPPKKLKSASSGLGVPALLLVVAAAGAYFYLNREKPPAADPASTEQEIPKVVEIESTPPAETPEPIAPEPEVEIPMPEPEIVTPAPVEPAPAPEQTAPVFDVPAFLVKARGIMAGRIAPDIKSYKADVVTNSQSTERKLNRLFRRLDSVYRKTAEAQMEIEFQTWVANDHMIAAQLPGELSQIDGADLIHSECLLKQEELRRKLLEKIHAQSSVYVLGLESQIKRLKETGDQAAIDLLEEEIRLTRNEEDYFTALFFE